MFPNLEPYESGILSVSDGQELYWECSGNPDGRPAVFIHGGPGSGSRPQNRRYFDPSVFRIVLFDQRGCGRSQPHALREADLILNTTHHLIEDLERLRDYLAIDRWTLLGVSWGTTLGLAYAEAHPRRVEALILALVTTTSRREVRWLTHDVGRIFPRQWEQFASVARNPEERLKLPEIYASLLFDADTAVCERAARQWCAWEDAHVSLAPGYVPSARFDDPEFRLRFARIVTHYWAHAGFLDDDQLLNNASRLDGIPGFLVHGRYDISSPLETAWQLHKRWRTSDLHILDDAGHGGGSLHEHIVSLTSLVAKA